MSKGRFGEYGGQYVPETLMNAVNEVEDAYNYYKNDPQFQAELDDLLKNYAGRPSLLYEAKKMTKDLGGAKIYLKREDLNHTGAHKINNAIGRCYWQNVWGKTYHCRNRSWTAWCGHRHGMRFDEHAMHCLHGQDRCRTQHINVEKMKMLGAEVRPVTSGNMTLKDATNEAIRDWCCHPADTYYVIGSTVGLIPTLIWWHVCNPLSAKKSKSS